MKKILPAIISVTICAAAVIAARQINRPVNQRFSGFYFDTAVTLKAVSENSCLIERCKEIIINADRSLSAYNPDSDVYLFNKGETIENPEINDLIKGYADFEKSFGTGVTPFCGSLTELWGITSDNPTVPSDTEIDKALKNVCNASDYKGSVSEGVMIDFGSGVKGYVCDKIYEEAASDVCVSEVIFSTGSSSLLWSRSGRKFTAEMINPEEEDSIKFIVSDSFISTSGGYERYFEDNGKKYTHIMDISSGMPVKTDIASVTAVLPCEKGNGLASDLLSTMLYIGGTQELERCSQICSHLYTDYGIIAIAEGGEVFTFGSIMLAE